MTTISEIPEPVWAGTLHLICVPDIQYVFSQDVFRRAFIVVAHCPKLWPIIVRHDEDLPAAMFAFKIEVTRACPFRAWLESNSSVKRIAAVAFLSRRFIAKSCRGVCRSSATRTKRSKPPKTTSLRNAFVQSVTTARCNINPCVCVYALQSLQLLVCRRVGAFKSSCGGVQVVFGMCGRYL